MQIQQKMSLTRPIYNTNPGIKMKIMAELLPIQDLHCCLEAHSSKAQTFNSASPSATPNGAVTNGIERRQTQRDLLTWMISASFMEQEVDAWDVTSISNLWILRPRSGLGGYGDFRQQLQQYIRKCHRLYTDRLNRLGCDA